MASSEFDVLTLVSSCILESWDEDARPSFTRASTFAELGADSVRLVEIVQRVECRLGCEFTEAQLLELVDVDDLCRLVETAR